MKDIKQISLRITNFNVNLTEMYMVFYGVLHSDEVQVRYNLCDIKEIGDYFKCFSPTITFDISPTNNADNKYIATKFYCF